MNTKPNVEILEENIYTHAVQLTELHNYTEKQNTKPYSQCNVLFVDHMNKSLWFTDKDTADHNIQLYNKSQA